MEWHLMRPLWLWAAVPAIMLILLLWRQRGRTGGWHAVIAPELLRHLVGENTGGRSFNWLPFILLGWLLAALAASGPSWEKIPQPIHQKQDAVVLLLDLSYSMKSSDLAPSRLDRARQKLLDLLRLRTEGQTGLIAYAGDTHIVTPLTDDTPTIANLLPALHPDMMPVPGSDPANAVAQGLDLLRSAGISQGTLLLVTDGITDKDSKAIAKAMKRSAAQLSIMSVGTATGAPIPLPQGGFVKDAAGTIVMPQLQEGNLRDLASASGGKYMRMQISDNDLDYLLADNPLSGAEQTLALDRTADTWNDLGYLFLLPLLPLVLALFRRGALLSLLPGAGSVLLLGLLLGQAHPAQAQQWNDLWQTPDQQGQRALEDGDDEAAANLFEDPAWAGTAAYRSGDYESAAAHFSEQETADNWYNRGNALARSGQLDEAIAAYEASLKLSPDQSDAQQNLDLLEELKKQEQEKQQQQDGEGDDSQEQEKNQESEQNQNQDQQQDQQQNGQQSDTQQPDDASQQNDQQSDASPEEEQQPNPSPQGDENDQQQREEQQAAAAAQEDEKDSSESGQQAQAAQPSPEEMERDQAMEQWLRRVPDDPSGLLREKFRYESRQRQQEGAQKDNEIYW